ncbi:MAG: NUDIX hydrolase [Balneolales bacterium]|nr:NUDIX hydrolase [Balneolales bacterium]
MSTSPHSGFIRVRVGGLLEKNNRVLLVKLMSPITRKETWIPPGGGVEFKESLSQALVREFKEETHLSVQVHELVHLNEILEEDFHVLELYYKVTSPKYDYQLGSDPEHNQKGQILMDIGFFSREEIQKMNVKPDFLKRDYWEI